MLRVEAKFLCECEDPEPFVYGNFDPPCYVCRKCGLNVTERVEGSRTSDSSKECERLLENFLDCLERIQEGVIVDSDGEPFGCFPWYSCHGGICAARTSPVCKVCRGLHICGLATEWRHECSIGLSGYLREFTKADLEVE